MGPSEGSWLRRGSVVKVIGVVLVGASLAVGFVIGRTTSDVEEVERQRAAATQRMAELEEVIAELESENEALHDANYELAEELESREAASAGELADEEAAGIGDWLDGEDGRIIVRQFEFPADPNREMTLAAGADSVFAAVQVAACPETGPVELSESDFVVVDMDFTRYTFWNVQDHAKEPRVSNVGTISPGECASGWVTYILPAQAQPVEVLYLGGDTFGPGIHSSTLTWKT